MSSSDSNLRKGQWSLEEDECLKSFVTLLGEKRWDAIAKATGLKRSGKSCRLRWLNYLRPSLKHSPISDNEEQIILRLHEKWGNKWARIARRLPGRTDNEIKNYWRGCLRKKTSQSTDQIEDKANYMEAKSLSPWNSDYDESDYNDVIKEMSLEGEKSDEPSPSRNELQEVLMSTPQSPYESHFSNWVLMLKSDQDEKMMSSECCDGYRDDISNTALDCWDGLWDMDLFNFM